MPIGHNNLLVDANNTIKYKISPVLCIFVKWKDFLLAFYTILFLIQKLVQTPQKTLFSRQITVLIVFVMRNLVKSDHSNLSSGDSGIS